jgi:hypothetical protein
MSASSKAPTRAADRVKTSQRDADKLARLLRASELIAVYVPEARDEATGLLPRLDRCGGCDARSTRRKRAGLTGGASRSLSGLCQPAKQQAPRQLTYCGQVKINIQSLLYCLVPNLEKLAHKSKTYGRKRPLPTLLPAIGLLPESFRIRISPFCSSSLLCVTWQPDSRFNPPDLII